MASRLIRVVSHDTDDIMSLFDDGFAINMDSPVSPARIENCHVEVTFIDTTKDQMMTMLSCRSWDLDPDGEGKWFSAGDPDKALSLHIPDSYDFATLSLDAFLRLDCQDWVVEDESNELFWCDCMLVMYNMSLTLEIYDGRLGEHVKFQTFLQLLGYLEPLVDGGKLR